MESFAPGAFADAGVHTLTAAHPRDGAELPIGDSVEVRDQADGLHGAWHVSDTDTGNEVLTLIRDGGADFRRYRLGQWTQHADAWLPREAGLACGRPVDTR
jgi:phage head maturation protease